MPEPTVTPYHHFIPTPTSPLPTPTPYMSDPGLPTVPGTASTTIADYDAITNVMLVVSFFIGIAAFALSRNNRRKQM